MAATTTRARKAPAAKKAPAKAPAKTSAPKHKPGPAGSKSEAVRAMLKSPAGASVHEVTRATGCSSKLFHLVVREEGSAIQVVGFDGSAKRFHLVTEEGRFPFTVGEYVRIAGEHLNGVGHRVITLEAGGISFDVVVPQ